MTGQCPRCHGSDIEVEGRAEPPLALLGEDEYVERCRGCGTEWVRNTTRTRLEVL